MRRRLLIVVVLVVIIGGILVTRQGGSNVQPVSLTRAVEAIEDGRVKRAEIDDNRRQLTVVRRDGTRQATGYPESYANRLIALLRQHDVVVTSPSAPTSNRWLDFALGLVPLTLIIVFLWYLVVKRGLAGAGALRKRSAVETPTVRFADVAGLDETVAELREITEWMADPKRFVDAGAKVPHGILLVGPPGVGKTLVAKAVAGEAGVPFYALSGSDFVETFVGVGAARVRAIFEQARKHERCVIFVDELDAVGQRRHGHGGGTEERETTLNQLLVELDGFHDRAVVVLGATNRVDVLDPALLRPGRFDRRITIPAPDRRGREQILELKAHGRQVASDVRFDELARRTAGFTGADLEALMNEAALEAARGRRTEITQRDVDTAIATTVLGRARHSAVPTERDRRITAWHEAAHALAALWLEDVPDPVQVSIVPHAEAGGVTWMGGTDHVFLTRGEALDQLQVLLAGRVGEHIVLEGQLSQGSSDDLMRATELANNMVRRWGMTDLGPIVVGDGVGVALGNQADELVLELLGNAQSEVQALLLGRQNELEAVANRLLEDETLTVDEIRAVIVIEPGHGEAAAGTA